MLLNLHAYGSPQECDQSQSAKDSQQMVCCQVAQMQEANGGPVDSGSIGHYHAWAFLAFDF